MAVTKTERNGEHKPQDQRYTLVKIARDCDIKEHVSGDSYFDLVDHDKVSSFSVLKKIAFDVFKEEVAREFGVPVQCQRFWLWARRINNTYRPNRPLTSREEAQPIGRLVKKSKKGGDAELKLFLEVELGLNERPMFPPILTKGDILLFFKLYEPEKGELRYVGRLFVKSAAKPVEILGMINQLAGFLPDEEIYLYEEVKFDPSILCEHLDKETSFESSEIGNGDIICFQKYPLESEEDSQYFELPSFLECVGYIQNPLHSPLSVGSTISSTSTESSSSVQMVSEALLAELSTMNISQSSPSSPEGHSSQALSPETLQPKRQILKYYLALSLEAIENTNAFDEIERIVLELIQHSTNSLERTILKDSLPRLTALRRIVPDTKSMIQNFRTHRTSLHEKNINVGERLDQGKQLLHSLVAKQSKNSAEVVDLDAEIRRLSLLKEELLIEKNLVDLELDEINKRVSKDIEKRRNLDKETEEVDTNWLQAREKLAQATLGWKLIQQNLQDCRNHF